jgi:hypothetical protein
MHLSDIKYQSLRKALESLKIGNIPAFKQYQDLSIDNFQPRILRGYPIAHASTVRTVFQTIEEYERRKQEAGISLTQEEHDGTFFFPLGSDEFNRESRKAGIPAYLNQDLSTNLISDGRVHGHPVQASYIRYSLRKRKTLFFGKLFSRSVHYWSNTQKS